MYGIVATQVTADAVLKWAIDLPEKWSDQDGFQCEV